MTKWKNYDVKSHGYTVDKERSDYRVSLEGVEIIKNELEFSKELITDFVNNFRHADSFTMNDERMYCWYD